MVPLYHAFTKAWLGKENTTLSVLTVTPEVDMAAEPLRFTNWKGYTAIIASFLN